MVEARRGQRQRDEDGGSMGGDGGSESVHGGGGDSSSDGEDEGNGGKRGKDLHHWLAGAPIGTPASQSCSRAPA